jgi:hypothetical protein
MSTIKVDTIKNTSNVEVFTAKAWVNFNGTGTVAIRASGNVSSVTDNGVGTYTVNFTTAMADANYGISGAAGELATNLANVSQPFNSVPPTVNAVRINVTYVNSTLYDTPIVTVAVFR